jgi:hypothetical protein
LTLHFFRRKRSSRIDDAKFRSNTLFSPAVGFFSVRNIHSFNKIDKKQQKNVFFLFFYEKVLFFFFKKRDNQDMEEEEQIPEERDIFSENEEDDEEDEDDNDDEEQDEEVQFDADLEWIIKQEEIEAQKEGSKFPKLTFTEVKRQTPPSSIPSKMPPKPNIIPERYFSSPKLLFEKIYGFEKIFLPILLATNLCFKAQYPNDPEFTIDELQIGFGMLIFAMLHRSKNHPMNSFWDYVRKNDLNIQNYNLLSKVRFKKLVAHLDVGENVYRTYPNEDHRHIDTKHKIWPFIQLINSITGKYCSLDWNFGFLSLDESLRRSYGKTDPIKRFNPSKPAKYGQQVEMVSGPDGLILSVLPDLDKKNKIYNSLGELFQRIIPKKCKNIGQRLAMDNFFISRESVEHLVSMKMVFVATCRRSRLGGFFGSKEQVPPLFFEKLKKGQTRKIVVFRAPFHDRHLDICAYFDKVGNQPVVFVTNASADFHKFSDLPHCSLNLAGKTKPAVTICYNKTMGGVDCIDQSLDKYSIIYQSRNDGKKWTFFARRMVLNVLDHLLHNLFIISKKHQIITKTKLPRDNHRAFLEKFCYELLGKKTAISPIVNPLPLQEIENTVSRFLNKPDSQESTPNTNSLIVISPSSSKRKMCVHCPAQRQGGKRSAFACAMCKKIVCSGHRQSFGTSFICKQCLE